VAPLRVLMAHSYYRQRGGEDASFEAERDLLRRHGHQVIEFVHHNEDVARSGPLRQASGTIWSRPASNELTRLIEEASPDVVHFQNTFPSMSPATIRAARASGRPVVATLRNFRVTCVNALLFRDGGPCEDCLGKVVPWKGIVHKCYRSRPASAVVAAMDATHHFAGTWEESVDRYIVLSEFQRSKLSKVLPPDRLVLKPNFLYPDPGIGDGDRDFALFVGRVSEEKGLEPLVEAWVQSESRLPLKVVGDGPAMGDVMRASGGSRLIEYLGRLEGSEVLDLLGNAVALVLPSLWYEGFPRVIIEAFAKGTPVVTYDIGTQGEVVDHETTGLVEPFGQPVALVEACQRLGADSRMRRQLGRTARSRFEALYTESINYQRLLEIYEAACA